MKKIKEAIARFFWGHGARVVKRLDLFFLISFAGIILTGICGTIVLVTTRSLFWGIATVCSGSFLFFLPLPVLHWQQELPEYKIAEVEKTLEKYPASFSETGQKLMKIAKSTGKTDQLEAWMKVLEEYEATVDELRNLKSQAVNLPQRIRQLERNAVDLRQSLAV